MNVNHDPSLSLLSALRPTTPSNRNLPQTQSSVPGDLLVKPNRTGLPPAARATAPDDLTVDGLLESWGGKSEKYDLNADGGVNMLDLVELLKSMATHGRPPTEVQPIDPEPEATAPPTNLLDAPVVHEPAGTDLVSANPGSEPTQLAPAAPESEPTQLAPPVTTDREPTQLAPPPDQDPGAAERLSVDDLLAAWGTDDPEFDLNSDGTVNMRDLIALLRDFGEAPAGTDLESGDPMTIRGLLENWGRSDSRYDLDSNGTVNMRDLVDMLSGLIDRGGGRPGTQLAEDTGRASFGGLKPIAASLVDRLRAGGFQNHPPSNIHNLVGSLNLSGAQEKALLEHLDAEYPAGLGVNLVG